MENYNQKLTMQICELRLQLLNGFIKLRLKLRIRKKVQLNIESCSQFFFPNLKNTIIEIIHETDFFFINILICAKLEEEFLHLPFI